MAETVNKRTKLAGPLIGTHNGHFHADEALAVTMLRLLPKYSHSPLVRTRDADTLKKCHTVVDVGGEYDPLTNRFDHHQRQFNTTFPGHSIKLSSAGLVFMHFGKAIIAQQTGYVEDSEEVSRLYNKMYNDFIEAFDAHDNGISQYDPDDLVRAGVKSSFNNQGFTLGSVVNRYNYDHSVTTRNNESATVEQLQEDEDCRFLKASEFIGGQFVAELTDAWKSWLPAQSIVREAFHNRRQYDEKGRIMVLKEGVPWQEHLYNIEKEDGISGEVLYVLFPENAQEHSRWRIRAVSVEDGGFKSRKPLPEKWRGIRDQDLTGVTGVEGCIFVHASGFIGGNQTFHGALKMAQEALDMA